MRKLYAATFHLGVEDRWTPPMRDAIDVVGEWIFGRHDAFRDADGFPESYLEPGRHPLGDDATLEVLRGETGSATSVGIRLHRAPDRDDARSHITEAVLAEERTDHVLRVAVSTYIGRRGRALRPEWSRSRPPSIVRDLVRRFGAYEDGEISLDARTVETADMDDVVRVLTAPERRLPVVLCSPRNRDDRPVVSPKRLAERLVGLAHVYLLANRAATLRLRRDLGGALACYDGAVRVYWPGSVSTARAKEHRYWTQQAVASSGRRFPDTVLRYLSRAAIIRVLDRPLNWHALEAAHPRTGATARDGRDDRVERLERQKADLTVRLGGERELARYWERAYTELWAEIEASGVELRHPPPHQRPESVEAAVRWALERYPDRLALALNSRSSLEDNPFEDPEAVRRALACLATTYVDARRGAISRPDLSEAFLAESGFHYSPHQSKTTMGRFPNHYEATWHDRTVTLEEHLKKGTGHDPRRTIRIAFFYDDAREQVVIGYIGLHQRNTAT